MLVTRIKTVPRPVILHFIQVIAPPATKSNVANTDTTTEAVVVDAVGIIDSAINDDDDDDDDDDDIDEVKQDHSNDGNQGPMIVDVDIVDDGDGDEGGEDYIPITSAPQKDRYAMRRVYHDILFYIQNDDSDGGDGGVDDDDDDNDIDEDDDDNI